MMEFHQANVISQEWIYTEMVKGIKNNQAKHRKKNRERRNTVLLISSDTSPGSVGVWTRHACLLIRSAVQKNWAAAAMCCLPSMFAVVYSHM